MILGMVGWRGMVGSVLTNRMREENDFAFADKVISIRPRTRAARPLRFRMGSRCCSTRIRSMTSPAAT